MSVSNYDNPDLDSIPDLLESARVNREVVCLFGTCVVSKTGRITGNGEEGDRLVICKPDGAISVQQPTTSVAVARQESRSRIDVSVTDAHIEINARSDSGKETLQLEFSRVYSASRFKPSLTSRFKRVDTEEEMHRYIIQNPETIEEGLRIIGHEVRVSDGRIDLVGRDSDGSAVVIEVKKRKANPSHVDQLYRYLSHFRRTKSSTARGILVAAEFSPSARKALKRRGMESVKLSEFTLESRHPSETTLGDYK